MQFSREGEHVVRCIISEEEIENLGYSIDDLMTNGERAQEFMNHIFDLAEREFAMKFDLGVKTVRADFLPDHRVSLTFSQHQGSAMMEHLKDIVNDMLNSIPKEKWEDLKSQAQLQASQAVANQNTQAQTVEEEEEPVIIAMVTFDNFDLVSRYAKQINMMAIPDSRLYKLKGEYILAMDLTGYTEQEVLTLSMITDEYASKIEVGRERLSMLEEHGEIIIDEFAIETLRDF